MDFELGLRKFSELVDRVKKHKMKEIGESISIFNDLFRRGKPLIFRIKIEILAPELRESYDQRIPLVLSESIDIFRPCDLLDKMEKAFLEESELEYNEGA